MRKLFILFGLILLAAGSAMAQEGPGFEVSGGYMYVRINPGAGAPASGCQGGAGTAALDLRSWLGVVGDFGACKVTGLPTGTSSHEFNYLFGPRVSFRNYGRVTPYVQALFGGDHASASVTGLGSASNSSFAMTLGGGVDFKLTHHLTFRAIQAEYFYTHYSGATQNNLRLQSALVYRWGK